MAITTISTGPNSAIVRYDAGESLVALIPVVEAFIVANGWAVLDTAAGTNARAYRAVCADGLKNKDIVLDYNTPGKLILEHYENWDEILHIGTFLALNSSSSVYGQIIDLAVGGDLNIFSNARWLGILGKVGSVFGGDDGFFVGVFERERIHVEDVFGLAPDIVPAFWGNGFHMGVGTFTDSTISYTKTHNLIVGEANGFVSDGVCLISFALPTFHNLFKPGADKFSGKFFANSVIVGAYGGFFNLSEPRTIYGRTFGLKMITREIGSQLDIAQIELDASLFYLRGGTLTDHHILTSANDFRYSIPI